MILSTQHIKQIIDDNERIKHILYCIEEIEKAVKEQTFDSFLNNKILRTAVSKWIEVIGESVVHITDVIKNKNTEIDWQKMVNLRNNIIYEYYDVDYHAIWEVIISLKELKKHFEAINLD